MIIGGAPTPAPIMAVPTRAARMRRVTPGIPQQGYWKYAEWLVAGLVLVVGIRLTELFGFLDVFKLVPLFAYVGGFLFFQGTSPAVRASVLSDGKPQAMMLYFSVCLVSMPFALWPGGAFEHVLTFIPVTVMYLTIVSCPPNRISFRKVQVIFLVIVALYALYAKTKGEVFDGHRLRVLGGMFDANDTAAIMSATLPIAAGLMLRSRGWLRAGAGIAALLLMVVLVATGSRGGILSFAAGATVFVFGLKGSKRLTGLLVLTIAAFTLWTMSGEAFRARMATLSNLEKDYNNTHYTGREQVWQRGVLYFKQHPVLGVGMQNFQVAEGEYLGEQGMRGKWSAAHNTFVQVFAELGVIGGGVLIAIYVAALRSAYVLWRGVRFATGETMHHPELLASLVGALVAGIFLSHAYFPPLFALLGIIALADRMRRSELLAKGGVARAHTSTKLRRTALFPKGRGGVRPARA